MSSWINFRKILNHQRKLGNKQVDMNIKYYQDGKFLYNRSLKIVYVEELDIYVMRIKKPSMYMISEDIQLNRHYFLGLNNELWWDLANCKDIEVEVIYPQGNYKFQLNI